MSNKLTPQTLFWTPKSTDELMSKINELCDDEKSIAMMYSMFTWNLCSHLINEDDDES